MEASAKEALFNSLKCFQCKKYLSILPIKIYSNEVVKCGRCSFARDAKKVSNRHEAAVENLKFPCINRYEGCTKFLVPKAMKIHEQICKKSKVSCPVCLNEFSDCSLLMVEHFKVQHPEGFLNYTYPSAMLNLHLSDRDMDILYLCVNSTLGHKAKILKILYGHVYHNLNVTWADIGQSCFQPANYELSNVEDKTVHKTCNGYTQIDLNEYPGHIIMCKIHFDSSGNKNNEELASKKLIKVPGLAVDPVFQAVTLSADKTLNIELEFPNIFLLTYQWQKTDILYLAGTSWYFQIKRSLGTNNVLYLNCCLKKKDDPIENKYSFRLNGSIGIRSIVASATSEMKCLEKAVTNRIFGKRPQESDEFMLTNQMYWKNDFNPQIADLSQHCIKISLNLQLTGIYLHNILCKCNGCAFE